MTSNKKLTLTFFLLTCILPIASADENKSITDIVASENDTVVKTSDVKLLLSNLNQKQQLRISQNEATLEQYILKLIRQKKVANKARELQIDSTPITKLLIEQAINEILEKQLISHARKNIKALQYPDQLAKEYYISHPDLFRIKEKIKASHILIKFSGKDKTELDQKLNLANEILIKLKNGLDFETAAKKYSDDTPSATNGGSLGYFERGKMVKEFEEAAFNLKQNGQLSDIVKTAYGFHIIKLLDKKESTIKKFESVKDILIQAEKNRYMKSELKKYWQPFNNNTNTTLYTNNLKELLAHLKGL